MDVVRAFALARAAVERLPESVGRALFSAAGTAMGLSGSAGARRLRANQARIRPGLGPVRARLLSAAAMRSYMRYYYECFRLPVLGEDRILARVQLDNDAELRADLASGRSATAALVHAGNWDMAGAWACIDLAPVHTLAERLEPAGLYEDFLRFRTGLGMTIYPVVRGGGGLRALEEDMAAGVCFTPILADRDLTASGVEVRLAGHAMLVAPGPALLAQRTGCAIYPVFSRYERLARRRRAAAGTRWGLRLTVGEPVRAETTPDSDSRERAADVRRMSQEWMDQFEPWLRAHLEDWHMLQPVFDADLDQERLARSHARDQQGAHEEDA